MIATRPARVSGAVSRQTRRLMIQSRILIQRGLKELQICRRFLVSMASTMPPSSKDPTRQFTSQWEAPTSKATYFWVYISMNDQITIIHSPALPAIKLTCSLSIPNILSICPTRLNYLTCSLPISNILSNQIRSPPCSQSNRQVRLTDETKFSRSQVTASQVSQLTWPPDLLVFKSWPTWPFFSLKNILSKISICNDQSILNPLSAVMKESSLIAMAALCSLKLGRWEI